VISAVTHKTMGISFHTDIFIPFQSVSFQFCVLFVYKNDLVKMSIGSQMECFPDGAFFSSFDLAIKKVISFQL